MSVTPSRNRLAGEGLSSSHFHRLSSGMDNLPLVLKKQVLTTILCYRLIAEQFAGADGSGQPKIGLDARQPGRSFLGADN